MATRTPHIVPTPLERLAGRFMRAPDHPGDDGALDNDDDNADDGDQSGQSGEADDNDGNEDGDADASDADDDDDSDGKPKNRRNGYEKRIAKLTRRAKEAEAALARERGEKGEKGEKGENKPNKPESKPEGKPLLKDFETYEDWVDALTDYKADQRINAFKGQSEKEKAETDFVKRFNAGRKSFKDWDEVVTDDVKITTAMQNAIRDTDIPADVIYYLGQNPDEAERILDLPAGKQALAIGKIEAKLEGKKSGRSGNNDGKRISDAPEPIKPTNTSGKKLTKSYDDMSYAEFVAQRRADARRAQGN